MRGAGDPLTIGERIAFYRRRRGLAQSTLASLVGRGEDWLSKIERGEREIRRLDILVEVAGALRVSLGDLLGEPVLMEDEHQNDDIPAVRDALMAPQQLSKTLFRSSAAPEYVDPRPLARPLAQRVESAWEDYQAGRLGRVVDALPRLIRNAQQLELSSDADTRAGAAVSARIHHLAATVLSKVGEADLAWIAAERAMRAADLADDPLVLASAARSGTHALLAVGRYEDALELGDAAARWLAPRMSEGDPAALSLYGMLHLRSAVAAARHQDRATVNDLLDKAEAAAEALGRDENFWQASFGPTNVQLHRISAGLDLGDLPFVIDRSRQIDTAGLPIERQVMHLIHLARALSLVAQDDEALQVLLSAEQRAPQLVRHSAMVREILRAMYRRAPVTAGRKSSELLALAQRCRAVGESA